MKKSSIIFGFAVLLLFGIAANLSAHCQIPCGIYGDKMRFDMLLEDVTTLKKSINQINSLSQEGDKNYNQIVRWVMNKEQHANKVMDIALNYFLAQRIKPLADHNDTEANKKYSAELETLHLIIVHAMKVKQTTDLAQADKLEMLIKKLYKLYFDEDMEQHLQEHSH